MKRLANWKPQKRIDGPGSRSNEERACSGEVALTAYLKYKGERMRSIELSDDLSDLLADLYHYAASEGLDLENNIKTAEMHFNAEQ